MSVVIDQQDNKVIEIDGEPKTLIIQGVGLPGIGLPTGGKKDEVLAKASNADFDTEWVDLKPTMIVTSIIFG
jgi:hypothetical protein